MTRTYYKAELAHASSSAPQKPTMRTHNETITAPSIELLMERISEVVTIPHRPRTIYRDLPDGDAEPCGFIACGWEQKCEPDDWFGKYWRETWVTVSKVTEETAAFELPVKLEVLQ